MKTKADAVKGWLRKAESDLAALRLCMASGEALDAACFHAQQAVEKVLKAYLTAFDLRFPFVHNLEQLVDVCAERDPAFHEIKEMAQTLTPYAVELRYVIESRSALKIEVSLQPPSFPLSEYGPLIFYLKG